MKCGRGIDVCGVARMTWRGSGVYGIATVTWRGWPVVDQLQLLRVSLHVGAEDVRDDALADLGERVRAEAAEHVGPRREEELEGKSGVVVLEHARVVVRDGQGGSGLDLKVVGPRGVPHIVAHGRDEEGEDVEELKVVCRVGVDHQHVELLENMRGVPEVVVRCLPARPLLGRPRQGTAAPSARLEDGGRRHHAYRAEAARCTADRAIRDSGGRSDVCWTEVLRSHGMDEGFENVWRYPKLRHEVQLSEATADELSESVLTRDVENAKVPAPESGGEHEVQRLGGGVWDQHERRALFLLDHVASEVVR